MFAALARCAAFSSRPSTISACKSCFGKAVVLRRRIHWGGLCCAQRELASAKNTFPPALTTTGGVAQLCTQCQRANCPRV